MSYINKNTKSLVRLKLTNVGRELLAKGQLTFNSFIIGDSEVDYSYVKGWNDFVPSSNALTGQFLFHINSGDTSINYSSVLRPKDNQYFPRTFLLDNNGSFIRPFGGTDTIKLIKGVISNEADDRGFFSGSTVDDTLTAVTSTRFIKETGSIDLSKFDGTVDNTTFTKGVLNMDTPLTASTVNDMIVFNFSNSTLGNITGNTLDTPVISQTYNITDYLSSGATIYVDRELPTLSASSGTVITYYVLPGGNDPIDDYYGLGSLTAYWHTGTLSFDSSCDICVENIPVWNMNNTWCENMAGQFKDTTDLYQEHVLFGSEEYVGTKALLGYTENNSTNSDIFTTTDSSGEACSDGVPSNRNESVIDPFQKSVSIIHYTNSCISNFYGEFFHIDEENGKLLHLDIPVLWHRKDDVGTESGTTVGMRFVSDGEQKTLSNSNIVYYDLIEFSGMSITPDNPLVVGKVFPNEEIIVVENEELVAAMSYKSNRNWTLPDLKAELIPSINGDCNGTLKPGERAYLTYYLDGGITPTLPLQRYTVIQNDTSKDKDLQFRLDGIDQLPYMRKIEKGTYDGKGFYATDFVLLAQTLDPTVTDRPASDSWRSINLTTSAITSVTGQTIDPLLLSNQNPNTTGLILDGLTYTAATMFNLGTHLDLPQGTYYSKMNFGDERLFYGNVRTYIGATVYKTLFTVNVDGNVLGSSSNPTYTTGDDRFITEVAILDNNQSCVMMGKLSRPLKISDSTTGTIELTIDF
jgi:hypothetical protein